MSGVFLSYSRADRDFASQIARGLRALGISVWWDEDMGGVDWQQELERQISTLSGVVVVWTESSRESKNVRDEARLALGADKLVNVLAGVAQPPFPFDRVNGLPLAGWTGLEPHNGWTRLIQTVEKLMVDAGAASPGEITDALAQREIDLERLRLDLAGAQSALQEAQAKEQEDAEVLKAANADQSKAEEQLQNLGAMRATALILRAAQQELEAAQTEQDAAERAHRVSKAQLNQAQRAFAKAEADLENLFPSAAVPTRGPSRRPPAPKPETPRATTIPPAPRAETTRIPAPAEARPVPRPAPVVEDEDEDEDDAPGAWIDTGTVLGLPVRTAMMGGIGALALVVVVVGLIGWRGGASNSAGAGPGQVAVARINPAQIDLAHAPVAKDIAGEWAMAGVGCSDTDNLMKIVVREDRLSLKTVGGTSTSTIISADDFGLRVRGDDGEFAYEVSGKTLTLTPPGGQPMKMTRCAG